MIYHPLFRSSREEHYPVHPQGFVKKALLVLQSHRHLLSRHWRIRFPTLTSDQVFATPWSIAVQSPGPVARHLMQKTLRMNLEQSLPHRHPLLRSIRAVLMTNLWLSLPERNVHLAPQHLNHPPRQRKHVLPRLLLVLRASISETIKVQSERYSTTSVKAGNNESIQSMLTPILSCDANGFKSCGRSNVRKWARRMN